ncbi:MAG TPA: coproporphyrinogen-III oxidase family protein [Chthoniobacteraceae bacterium]|jgi:oxygen-independent coproporphyrinogen-3 oxidase|nr:coproporphyrinogen-III oxidase family protein [Chthoniobacteraceae bacterium]
MSTPDRLRTWLAFVEEHPHDFTIQYPPRREYFMRHFRSAPPPSLHEWLGQDPELLLYLHVPFCEAKCYYCNFAVDVSPSPEVHRAYVDALLSELDSHAPWLTQRRVLGVDIGGGTPTRLPTSELARLLEALRPFVHRDAHPFPVSIETTPRIAAAEPEKLAVLRAGGVDRVSLGVQSFNAETLASVNRRRQIEQTSQAVANARAAGFARVNLDVIFALPNQTLADWQTDLDRVVELAPDSVTTYDCLYRGHGRVLTRRTATLPAPETYGALYDAAYQRLTAAGYHANYGSVNFSRRPDETGTSAYFEGRLLDGRPYLGLGNYSTSLARNQWAFNVHPVREYTDRIAAGQNPVEFFYDLPLAESQAKYALYSLNYGFIDEARFEHRFGVPLHESFNPELTYALETGWLEHRENRWHVTPGEFAKMHAIRSLFYPEMAREWLMSLA